MAECDTCGRDAVVVLSVCQGARVGVYDTLACVIEAWAARCAACARPVLDVASEPGDDVPGDEVLCDQCAGLAGGAGPRLVGRPDGAGPQAGGTGAGAWPGSPAARPAGPHTAE